MTLTTSVHEIGPALGTALPNFRLADADLRPLSLDHLMGGSGLVLAMITDVWQPTSVRRIVWLRRHISKFALMGTPVALMACNDAGSLYGFQMSSSTPVMFPLLADTDGAVRRAYGMGRSAGLLLIDNDHVLRAKWLVNDDHVWPKMGEITQAIESLMVYA
jgi:peroxiredoxin